MLRDIDKLNADPAMTSPFLKLHLEAAAGVEDGFAEVMAGVLDRDEISVKSHFFDDLDADSMVMARFCARVRKREDLPTVSMKDIYRYPTITSLATALAPVSSDVPAVVETTSPEVEAALTTEIQSTTTARYRMCGALQALIALGYVYLNAVVLNRALLWLSHPTDLRDTYVRAVEFSAGTLLGYSLIPIVAKWVLIGRWKPQTIKVWSLAYLRFWCVKTLMRANPMVLFAGSPIYTVYLRFLGAKIGKNVLVYSPTNVCTDLLTIGDNTVVRKDAQLPGYRAVAGLIEIGPITLGNSVITGEQIVIDIDSSIGDGARMGHSSSLHAGQHIPAGEFWQGSPARPTDATYPEVQPVHCGSLRKLLYTLWQLVIPLGLTAPVVLSAPVALSRVPDLAPLLGTGPQVLGHGNYFRDLAAVTLVLFLGGPILNLLRIMTVPRILNLGLKPGRVYPLYGFHYWLQRTITRQTNSAFFMELVGDSSYVVHYLRALGYDLGRYEQTGTNFGVGVKHDNPYLSSVGAGTVVADGLSIINMDYSSTSFQLSEVSVAERSFLGNAIAYPASAHIGRNCLLATKMMVPTDGPQRENVGLLGAPSFEIPRTVERDSQLEVADAEERRARVRAKNRHNTVTIVMWLVSRWIPMFIAVAIATTAVLNANLGAGALLALSLAAGTVGLLYMIMLQRLSNPLQTLRPDGCSIYDREFWRHERYWKIPVHGWMNAFNGTPLKPMIWRALGTRVGRRVFDDGFSMPEKSLVTIGDDCTLNAGSGVQCHSQEDGAFKSDRTTIGAGATLGVGAFVHYGVTIGDGVVLAPDTFVMKGEELPERTRWIGNPAALAITTSTAYPPAPAALPADSAPVRAALASRPRAVVEWSGQGWSFPELEHFTEQAEGPVTRLRIDRPGTLRLIGSGEGLRIELIPDNPDHTKTAVVGLPLPSELLAQSTHPRHRRSYPVRRGLSRPYAAALMLIAAGASGGLLLDVTHVLPPSTLIMNTTCDPATPGCTTSTTPSAAAPLQTPDTPRQTRPGTSPDPESDTSADSDTEASQPRPNRVPSRGPDTAANPKADTAPPAHDLSPFAHQLTPGIHRPPAAPKPMTPPAPRPPLPKIATPIQPDASGPRPSTATPPDATATAPSNSAPTPHNSAYPDHRPDNPNSRSSDHTTAARNGTTTSGGDSSRKEKKTKKSKQR